MYLVSACLAGFCCRYDGKSQTDEAVVALVAQGGAIPFCPEQMGGCATPRSPSEITGGDGGDVLKGGALVVSKEGANKTAEFLMGAKQALAVCRLYGVDKAILKAHSPSCGSGEIYDGSFSGALTCGDGVTAALLKQNGIEVVKI